MIFVDISIGFWYHHQPSTKENFALLNLTEVYIALSFRRQIKLTNINEVLVHTLFPYCNTMESTECETECRIKQILGSVKSGIIFYPSRQVYPTRPAASSDITWLAG